MILLVFQGSISFGYGHSNGWGDPHNRRNRVESNVVDFFFSTHYGAHDWIAESALRVILESSYSSHILNWLYDDNLGIPFKDFDEYVLDPRPHQHWWYKNNYKNYPQLFGSDSLQDTRYLFTKRLYYFVHGTKFPDFPGNKISIGGGLPSEQFQLYEPWMAGILREWWLDPHEIFFRLQYPFDPSDPSTNKYIPSRYVGDAHGIAAELCQLFALAAIYCLNVKQTFYYYDENGQEVESEWHGKYHAAAKCLGALTHYIADLSIPHHTIRDSTKATHENWEEFAQYEFLMKFDKSLANGRPCWDIIDPRSLITSESLDIKPILPYVASISMAEKTFLACDEGPNKDVYAYDAQTPLPGEPYLCSPYISTFDLMDKSHIYHSMLVERAKKLISYSVYYTACAILWICELAKMNERTREDTISQRLTKPATKEGIRNPTAISVDQIKDWGLHHTGDMERWLTGRGVDPQLASKWAQSFSMTLFILVPFIALASAFILQGVLEDPLKNLKS